MDELANAEDYAAPSLTCPSCRSSFAERHAVVPVYVFLALCFGIGRTAQALPPCDSLPLDQLSVDTAVAETLASSQLESGFAFGRTPIDVATSLGCSIVDLPDSVFTSGFEFHEPAVANGGDCGPLVCPGVRYCGAGNSTNNVWTIDGSKQLNSLCAAHDFCYTFACFESTECAFANNNAPLTSCDYELINYCDDFDFSVSMVEDYIVCKIVNHYRTSPAPSQCYDSGAGGELASAYGGTINWTCEDEEPSSTPLRFVLKQNSVGLLEGTATYQGLTLSVRGQRHCNDQWNIYNRRGRGVHLNAFDANNTWTNSFTGNFVGASLMAPASSMTGSTPYGYDAQCEVGSTMIGPTFTANAESR